MERVLVGFALVVTAACSPRPGDVQAPAATAPGGDAGGPGPAQSAPAPAVLLPLVVDDRAIRCGTPDRCAGAVSWKGEVTLGPAAADATISYGPPEAEAPTIDWTGLALATPPAALAASGPDPVVTIPMTVRWQDGVRAEGALPLPTWPLVEAIDVHLSAVTRGPVAVPGDGAARPPRAMWITSGGSGPRLYGTASSFAEVDWVLVLVGGSKALACPDGSTGALSVDDVTIYERRTGRAVATQRFEPHVDRLDPDRCVPAIGQRDTLGPGRWAWERVRRGR